MARGNSNPSILTSIGFQEISNPAPITGDKVRIFSCQKHVQITEVKIQSLLCHKKDTSTMFTVRVQCYSNLEHMQQENFKDYIF